jgi:hypothetical protein
MNKYGFEEIIQFNEFIINKSKPFFTIHQASSSSKIFYTLSTSTFVVAEPDYEKISSKHMFPIFVKREINGSQSTREP